LRAAKKAILTIMKSTVTVTTSTQHEPVSDPVRERHKTIQLLEGDLPSPLHPPSGCVFRTRCPKAQADCAHTVPPLLATHHSASASANPNAFAACIHLKADNAAAR
jgi:oligopeptide/dipeptide ABC transporter ATP-binding protein